VLIKRANTLNTWADINMHFWNIKFIKRPCVSSLVMIIEMHLCLTDFIDSNASIMIAFLLTFDGS